MKIEKKHLVVFFFVILFINVLLKYLLEIWIFRMLLIFLLIFLIIAVKGIYVLGDFIKETKESSISNFVKSFGFEEDFLDKNSLKGLIFSKDIGNVKIFDYIFKNENNIRYEIFNVSYTKNGLNYTKTVGRSVTKIELPNIFILSKYFSFGNLEKSWAKVELESNSFNRRFNLFIDIYSAENQVKVREFFDPQVIEVFMDRKLDVYQIEIYSDSIIIIPFSFIIRYDDLRRLYKTLQIVSEKARSIK
jgi:hypothetical protein